MIKRQMQIYRKVRDNGAFEPWNKADEWVFEVNLDWWQFLIGGGFYDGCLHLSLGPLTIIYFRDAWQTLQEGFCGLAGKCD